MPRLTDVVLRVRSKNAGPFWITIDVFCGTPEAFDLVSASVSSDRVASLYQQPESAIKQYLIPDLNVIKFSLPRPCVQGSRFDRDMHGAQMAALLAELEINTH